MRDEDTGRISGWLVAAAVVAIALAGWNVWDARERAVVIGDVGAIASAGGTGSADVDSAVHPLATTSRPGSWTQVADGEALGRGGTNALDDLQVVFDGEVGAVSPVPALRLADGQLAWATPRQVRLVDVDARTRVARIDACDDGIDATARAGDRLVVGGCARAVAVDADGGIAWSVEVPGDDASPIELLQVGDDVVVGRIGSTELVRLRSADGERAWRHDLRAPLRSLGESAGDTAVTVAEGEGQTRIERIDLADGTSMWERRWRGWSATATGSDSRRVVVALVQRAPDRGGASGLAQLDAASGRTTGTRALDRRVQVAALHYDAGTSRMASLVTPRGCTLERVVPRVDLLRARDLGTVQRVALDARPCSSLAARGRLVMVATCDEAIAIDALDGSIAWRMPVPATASRRALALSIGPRDVTVTDDVGTLFVLTQPSAGSNGDDTG